MSKKQSKVHASSGKAGGAGLGSGFGFGSGLSSSSRLSYAAEPPDLTLISDANIVVTFKNLTKKDGTTKTKALEELLQYLHSIQRQHGEVEDAILQAWVKCYPRLSIDSDRRVRQLSHTLQGRLSAACGKRIALYLPTLVGSWLAGLYDSDRATARGAQDSLKLVFPAQEKLHGLRKIYHESIVRYCQDAILHETSQTLSDERSVSPDDAEAKYVRVVSSTIMLMSSLLADMEAPEIAKHQGVYDELLDSKDFWKFSYHKDPSIRRSVYRLLRVCLEKVPDNLSKDLEMISSCIVYKGLGTDQLGSAADFLESLTVLTKSYPTVWKDHYHSKKPAFDRLQHFLSRGSQAGTTHVWYLQAQLLQEAPIIPQDLEGTMQVLRALHNGVASKGEPASNREAAWTAYMSSAEYLCSRLVAEDRARLLSELVLPIVRQHIKPTPSEAQWNLSNASRSTTLLLKAVRLLGEVLRDAWPDISSSLVADMKASSPEQSRTFESSQDSLAAQGERWASVLAAAISESFDAEVFSHEAYKVIEEAMSLLKSRNGKPYAAASVIESILRDNPLLPEREKALHENLSSFLLHDTPGLITSASPSSTNATRLLLLCNSITGFQEACSKTLKGLSQEVPAQDEVHRKRLDEVLEIMLCSPQISHEAIAQDLELQDFIVRRFTGSVENGLLEDDDTLMQQLLRRRSDIISSSSMDKVLSDLTESLSISEQAPLALKGLEVVQRSNDKILREFVKTSTGSRLASNLLLLSESADEELAIEGSNLSASLMTTGGPGSHSIVFNIISKGLGEASPDSVSIDSLVDLAQRLWNETREDQASIAARLLPTASATRESIDLLLISGPKHELSITSPLGGAVYLTDATEPAKNRQEWDASGFSKFLRLAIYTSQLIAKTNLFELLDLDHRIEIFRFLEFAVQFTNEDITLGNVRGLFAPAVEAEVSEVLSGIQGVVHRSLEASREWWLSSTTHPDSLVVARTVKTLFESATGTSPSAYYSALAYATLVRELVEMHGQPPSVDDQKPEAVLRTLRKSKDELRLASFSVAMQSFLSRNEESLTMLNGLIANLTGLKAEEEPQEVLRQLVLANTILQNEDAPKDRVTKQRVVFFVQHITQWATDPNMRLSIQAETLRALVGTIGYMKDMYGSHWPDILHAILGVWKRCIREGKGRLPLLHASLRLFGTLRSLSEDQDVNDDLLDAWKDTQTAAAGTLISVLKSLETGVDDSHQPQRIVDDLLARQISKTPLGNYEGLHELFPLIQAQSESIQKTAFAILDVQIPAKQEQISFDAALDKKNAQLPDELLSLILETPSTSDLEEIHVEPEVPRDLRAYLLSWLLVFDHFKNSSYKVKADYSENIKEGGYITGLLDLISGVLGHSRGRAIDASKFDIVKYDPNLESLPEKDVQWLLVHLYYLSMKYTPSLVKAWWIECRSRQKVISIESWTEKYFSPLIIMDALDSASEWANTQDASSDEQLTIKVNHRTREISAAYVVDEQTMMMAISLPGAYPLQQARVEGISRVAVEEKKWLSWLTNCRGVITFSNGSIPDGLSAWRKNVVGALRGQTECAICYSIISADKQLPTKRCGTCKNLFHSSCLFKWFKSSNASTCPLCRNPFNYG
ncbi:hypothetical protein EV356DRAFT_482442 [Viridothelium virens]|uniref:E3 ubiquitin-protein ligase listerin n=1 Tax=Viridothelium virens TaxID=1048519 RepID=A0A6A6HDU0_VIRVR|nr:hypothetical protein EV356DRAFT_482442 [Viridothelium virens]